MSYNKVIVTGANGQSGKIIMRLLQERNIKSRGIVRSETSGNSLREYLKNQDADIKIADISKTKDLKSLFEGFDTLIIATGSTPKINLWLLPWFLLKKLCGKAIIPYFYFPAGQSPREIDYLSQKHTIDQAKDAGVKHIICISSMCGTKPETFLNTNMVKVCLWKR